MCKLNLEKFHLKETYMSVEFNKNRSDIFIRLKKHKTNNQFN